MIKQLSKIPVFQKLGYFVEYGRCREIVDMAKPYMNKANSVIDIGAGTCVITQLLRERGLEATALDIQDISIINDIQPQIYNGAQMPYDDDSFDLAFIAFVLHHTPRPESILKESARIAKRVILFEDLIETPWQRRMTFFLDSLFNFKGSGHPHTNKSHKQWMKAFDDLNLKVVAHKTARSSIWIFKPMLYGIYALDK